MEILDFVLTFEPPGGEGFPISVSSPGGQGRGLFRPPCDLATIAVVVGGISRQVRDSARDVARRDRPSAPPPMGRDLAAALFSGPVRDLYQHSQGMASAQGRALRLRIEIDPARPELRPLSLLPWELMASPGPAQDMPRLGSIVRFVPMAQSAPPRPVSGTWRVLAVASSPSGLPPLDVEKEKAQLAASLQAVDGIDLRFLDRAQPDALRDALLDWRPLAVHFMGHGGFDTQSGAGSLLLESPADGGPHPIAGKTLAALFQVAEAPALVVLNACNTARQTPRAGLDAFAGTATALLDVGIPTVVAMQFPISDAAAVAFSRRLYARLATGDTVDAAVAEGRLAIHQEDDQSLEWATPVLFSRVADGVVTAPVAAIPPRIAEILALCDAAPLIAEKTRGFVGRQFVFEAVRRFVDQETRGYFIVRGDPGIGKTALLAELVRTGRHLHHFNAQLRNVTRADQFLANVCAQVIAKFHLAYTALPSGADRTPDFLLGLLTQAREVAADRKVVVLVDALDEADITGLSPGANLLCLPETLPPGVYFVMTARPLETERLPLRIDCECKSLLLDPASAANREDVQAFLQGQLTAPGVRRYLAGQGLAPAAFVEQLAARSEGNFMYLRCVLWEIEANPRWQPALADLPRGLGSYYEDHWRRMRAADEPLWFGAKLPVLLALTAAREPIPVDWIAAFSRVEDRRVIRSVLREWRPFLHVEGEPGAGRRYRLYHASFFDFLKDKEDIAGERVSLRQAHAQILQALLAEDEDETPGPPDTGLSRG
jgi:hypothetical protein